MEEDDEVGEDEDGPGESAVDPEQIDERIDRLETIVRALESGEVAPGKRAVRIAEGKALVEELERDLETVEEEEEREEEHGDE